MKCFFCKRRGIGWFENFFVCGFHLEDQKRRRDERIKEIKKTGERK